MMKFLVIILSLLFIISCGNQKEANNKSDTLNAKEYKEDVQKAVNTCKLFIEKFPSKFSEFNRLYGYDDIKGGGILYSKYEDDLSYFFSCSGVSNLEKLKKAILICIDGKWDADAVGMLQHKTLELIKEEPNNTLFIMNNLSDRESTSVWHFLLDGPHPNSKQNFEIVEYLSNQFGVGSKQTKILREQYSKLKLEESY